MIELKKGWNQNMNDKIKENKIYKYFTILSLFLGIVFSILIPLYQVPDEETHINEIYKFLGEEIDFGEETKDFGDTERIIKNYDEKVDIDKYFVFKTRIDVIDKVEKIDIHLIRYLPQTVGILISELLELPIIFSVTLSEILAVIFYTLICVLALKLMPIKKEVLMMIMLLPICIQQVGSFSYDMMLNSLSFLFIAYIFNLKLVKQKVNNKDLIKLLLLLLSITLIKIPYILLGLLIFIIPLKQITLINNIKKVINTRIKKIITIIILSILSVIGILFLSKISYAKVLISFIINPIDSLTLLSRTLVEHFGFYIMSIMGYFGWHDTPVSILFGVFIILSILIVNLLSKEKYNDKQLSKKDNIYIFVLGIFSCIIIIISLFEWTINYNGIDTSNFTLSDFSYYVKNTYDILGVQGRYFVPILPLLIIPINLKIKKENKKQILKIIQIIYYLVLFVYMFIIIINRYWI